MNYTSTYKREDTVFAFRGLLAFGQEKNITLKNVGKLSVSQRAFLQHLLCTKCQVHKTCVDAISHFIFVAIFYYGLWFMTLKTNGKLSRL